MPEIQRGQGAGTKRQVPRRPHAQLRLLEQEFRLSASADGTALGAAVEGREGCDPLQRVGDSSPTIGPQLVSPGQSHMKERGE